MGSPVVEPGRLSDELEHRVTITRPFLMKASEVTQEDWFERTGQRPSFFQGCGDECPVEMVSWYEAIAFCNSMSLSEGLPACYEAQGQAYDFVHAKAHVEPSWPRGLTCTGYRLPTEAEYAARAGSNSAFHTGPPDGEQRVGRGGFWYSRVGFCRAAKRLTGAPAGRGNHIGFRVARTTH